MGWRFSPPVVEDGAAYRAEADAVTQRLWGHFRPHSTGVTVARTGDTFVEHHGIYSDDFDNADAVYLGGHSYPVTESEKDALVTAGYPVTEEVTDDFASGLSSVWTTATNVTASNGKAVSTGVGALATNLTVPVTRVVATFCLNSTSAAPAVVAGLSTSNLVAVSITPNGWVIRKVVATTPTVLASGSANHGLHQPLRVEMNISGDAITAFLPEGVQVVSDSAVSDLTGTLGGVSLAVAGTQVDDLIVSGQATSAWSSGFSDGFGA